MAVSGLVAHVRRTDANCPLPGSGKRASELVGVAGFEPAASSSRTKRAAKLRYTPPAWNLTGTARDFDSLAEARACSRIARPSANHSANQCAS